MTPHDGDGHPTGRRWLARASLAAMAAGVVVVVWAQGLVGLTLVVVGLLGAGAMLAGGTGSSPRAACCGGSG